MDRLPFDYRRRIDAKRARGTGATEVARYAHDLVLGVGQRHGFNEDDVDAVLSGDEVTIFRRLRGELWVRRNEKRLKQLAEHTAREKGRPQRELREAEERQRLAAAARERKRLKAAQALTPRGAAAWLEISIAELLVLWETGELPADGYVSIQHSRGKPVLHWLPATLMRFKSSRKPESDLRAPPRIGQATKGT